MKMVFGGKFNQIQERYSTWDEAEAGHKKMVERLELLITILKYGGS